MALENIDISKLTVTVDKILKNTISRFKDNAVNDMKIYAPVDTGALRDSIGIDDDGDSGFTVGASVDYAPFVELGTERTAPQPFVRPVLDSIEELLRRSIR